MIFYITGLILSLILGLGTIRLLSSNKTLLLPLDLFNGLLLGVGFNGLLTFILQLCLNIHHPAAIICGSLILTTVIVLLNLIQKPLSYKLDHSWTLIVLLIVIGTFIWLEAHVYPMGGWDAWSCWNLKAKFIYLGKDHWQDIFDPLLWRSNTQYPLLLPCINVWFFNFSGGAFSWIPMHNAILFYTLCAGILAFSIYHITRSTLTAALCTAPAFLLPFNLTLGASQYSDILVGSFLLGAFAFLLRGELILTAVFLGLLSFTKTEGTAAAGILAFLIILHQRKSLLPFIAALCISFIPTLYFNLMMAPPNEAFVNGLLGGSKPSSWSRLQTIFIYPWFEIASLKWNGLWLILAGWFIWGGRSILKEQGTAFALFFTCFFAVLLGYYQMNTFFEINWWLNTTLHRILFALLPAIILWMGSSFRKDA